MNIELSQVGLLLGLGSGQDLIFSLLLYIIFFLALITMLLLPDKNLVATLLIATVMLCAIVAKLSLASYFVRGADPILSRGEFGMLAINALMFTFPFIVVGVTRKARLKKDVRSGLPSLICGLMGGVYFFLYWLIYQRPLG